jgi:hypothetical protein
LRAPSLSWACLWGGPGGINSFLCWHLSSHAQLLGLLSRTPTKAQSCWPPSKATCMT